MIEYIDADQRRLLEIFSPELLARVSSAITNESRFVHYTSSTAAASIIQNNCVWLRNATTMNDYSEINFGINAIIRNFAKSSTAECAKDFWCTLDELRPSLGAKVIRAFDDWVQTLRTDTYIFCVSEHKKSEDDYGRLSMWRAYGGKSSVAMVFNPSPFHTPTDALNSYTYPVTYKCERAFDEVLRDMANRMRANVDFLKTMPEDELANHIFDAFQTYCICSKHVGFEEELEWRVVHLPSQNPHPRIKPRPVEINGVPQLVYPIPLVNIPEEGLTGITLNELLDRLIIGPTEHPAVAYDFFVHLLTQHGIPDAHSRVFISNIPLRSQSSK